METSASTPARARPGFEYTVVLNDLAIMLRLGIHPEEQSPQRVLLNVRMTVAYESPVESDDIAGVLDYDFVRIGIRELAGGDGFALQETLCEKVAALCFRDRRVIRVEVRSEKPDIYPDARVGCEIVRIRSDEAP